jgi:hypothetical protein
MIKNSLDEYMIYMYVYSANIQTHYQSSTVNILIPAER